MKRRWAWLLPLAAAALVAGGLLRHLASEKPDGLETVAEKHGFADREARLVGAPMPEYELPWHKTALGKSLVGVGGALGAFGLVFGLGVALRLRRRRGTATLMDAPSSDARATATDSPSASPVSPLPPS